MHDQGRLLDRPLERSGLESEDRRPDHMALEGRVEHEARALAGRRRLRQKRGKRSFHPARGPLERGRPRVALADPSKLLPDERPPFGLQRTGMPEADESQRRCRERTEAAEHLCEIDPPRIAGVNYDRLGEYWTARARETCRHDSEERPAFAGLSWSSGRRDSNSGPLVPQTSALTRLRHAPRQRTP